MNQTIKKELNKLKQKLDIEYDDNTTSISIPCRKQSQNLIKKGGTYIIKIAPYILCPSDNFTLASNWNKGVIPKSAHMKCEILNIMGKMIKVQGVGYDIDKNECNSDSYSELWLPIGGITVVKCLP